MSALALVRASHPGPVVAVTALALALAVSEGLGPVRVVLVGAAVFFGQLTVGWSNDLVDRARDSVVGRTDKPLATGELDVRLTRLACGAAVVATVVLSLACGWMAGLVHLGCVAVAWAYNLGLKSTVLSWLPYAAAFGGLTVFVALAGQPPALPAAWVPLAAAMLGVGAHLVNALPDLADDAATGVRGLPHRLGAGGATVAAAVVLVAGSVVAATGTSSAPRTLVLAGLVVVVALGVVAVLARGRTPFRAAVAIALVDAVLVVAAR
ncbi:UbiA family prenyltransferase [Nocardioides jishulii]|uniref:Ubiquinone biosynthesis protein UbiA n=1 Tax=Nocardioides jishulii TaxID=2575440 RepID=A0A4U2YNG0_9ACTN|nr:UbiA family prenyltransferase [Nocardioides jishulii]QCX27379.1 hypothetical protein FCL41_07470 [Nocardioides jishulii]TKI62185.1 hypothetical protein FC770_07135 [Nocardioides jishulii]